MLDRLYPRQNSSFLVAEPNFLYRIDKTKSKEECWVEVLVNCPDLKKLYTYRLPSDFSVRLGDIVSVPFGAQILGGIAIRYSNELPEGLSTNNVKEVETVITSEFFPECYWQLLERVAEYYLTDLVTVINAALPPGLLENSQRRICLDKYTIPKKFAIDRKLLTFVKYKDKLSLVLAFVCCIYRSQTIPDGYSNFCQPLENQIIKLLYSQKDGDYSVKHIYRQIGASNYSIEKAIRQLVKRGWVESYLEPPQKVVPKMQKAVILLIDNVPIDITKRQREVLDTLRNKGGELWLKELIELAKTSSSVINTLAERGYVNIEERERLRLLVEKQGEKDSNKQLNLAQTNALETIQNSTGYTQILLHGVTGSGKTEVYLQAIDPILAAGKSALVLVPEIGLTPQLTDRFRARFGDRVCVYHSALSDGERYDTWRQMLAGEPQVVIGTRSAIFAPLPELGLIVLDEEHDSSFKQTQILPTYHARTVAKWRAQLADCPLILGSATPSIETWLECGGGRVEEYGSAGAEEIDSLLLFPQPFSSSAPQLPRSQSLYLSLPERIASRPLPPVEIVDLRQELKAGNRSIFSRSLKTALLEMKDKGQQGILFVSRRGHSTFVSCRSCGYVMECPHCDVSLSYHYTHEGATELLHCHYCGHTSHQPRSCPDCGSPYFKFFGSGTQRVVRELEKEFPQLRSIRFDSDTTRTKGSHRELLERFAGGEADVLVGTQMLTKGIDLAGVTLVGIMAADGLLHHADYRAAERTFQTLTQVAGRAGRGEDVGKVILQTYAPEHPVIRAVERHDYHSFIAMELEQREVLGYPPYGSLVSIRFSGRNEAEVAETARKIAEACGNGATSNLEILGPAPASIMRVADRYRWQILLKWEENDKNLQRSPHLQLDWSKLRSLCPRSVSMLVDVDPIGMD
jgi:primosomal protein N' (replication factor Y) (superfamily II helicase)